MKTVFIALAAALCVLPAATASAQGPNVVVYEGSGGPGAGKHIVFLAGDHEYRSEEALPALARILARHYGFKCSVFFTTDPKTGFIEPGSSNISGLEALKTADLMVIFLRFQDFPDAEMKHIVDYVDRGGPVVGFRTATHAFEILRPGATYAKYTRSGKEPGYTGGFGRQVLGETWVAHSGTNHRQSARLALQPSQANHPVLRGVKDVWVESGVYTANPIEGSVVLAMGEILDGMTPDAPVSKEKPAQPVAWVRDYTSASGKTARVFTTTHGASEDFRNDGFRRLVVNACLWAAGLDAAIRADGTIAFVGPYIPSRFNFNGFVKGLKPSDMAGWDAPIPVRR
jgi:type 1 glutamine amidotransferase